MIQAIKRQIPTHLAAVTIIAAALVALAAPARTQTGNPTPPPTTTQAPPARNAGPAIAAPASPTTATPPSSTPPTPVPAPAPEAKSPEAKSPEAKSPEAKSPEAKSPDVKAPAATPEGVPLAPGGKVQSNEIEPNATPTTPQNATTENVEVPSRPLVAVSGRSSYDDAFKSIKTSLETVKAAMDKAGLKASGHPITIFSAPDDKGFKYQAGVPVAQKPEKGELGNGVTIAMSPSGKAIKFQHRGPYDDIDATYDVITAFLDAKGLQVDSPYIEEYLTELTTADDPNLQVDVYVFVK